ncbi:MAG: FAD-dependent oxidoreductase [Actinobacteria bacterium]|nr:FAD-dependent oxidoreductase [Actinomycetota bacterium]
MITIIGGGPAGIAAALAAARGGERVRIIEGTPRLGGQYWRHLPEEDEERWVGQEKLHDDFQEGYQLRLEVLRHPNIEILFNTHVWHAEIANDQITLNIVRDSNSSQLSTEALILATGAYDRSLPFPGWDIPGVMTAGAAQSLLKGSYVHAGRRVVVAGTGPFLMPVASGLLNDGVAVVGLFEANRISRWIPFTYVVLANFSKVLLARKYMRDFSVHKVKFKRGHAVVRANAGPDGVLRSVTVAKVDRKFKVKMATEREILCDALAISWGFTPDMSIAHNLGIEQHLDVNDGSVVVVVDECQQTSVNQVFAAGEVTGIGGSELAMTEGEIAGMTSARTLGAAWSVEEEEHFKGLVKKRAAQRRFARALSQVYGVQANWMEWLTPETLICRCEEVSIADIQNAVHNLGATNIRSTKLFTRVGMGLCQGRTCSRSVIEILSKESGVNAEVEDHLSAAKRQIVHPISLGMIANSSSVEDSHHNH